MKHDLEDVGCDLHEMTEKHLSAHGLAGYVLITCGHSKSDKRLDVRMSYQGDPILVSYLLENGVEKMLHDIEAAAEDE